MHRELLEVIGSQQLTGGVVFGLFLGTLYMFGAIFMIYTQYLNAVIFNIFTYLPDGVKPLFFPLLHSLLFLVLNFFSTLMSGEDMALSAVIGSDCFILFFFAGYASIKFVSQKKIMTLDPWVTFQDGAAYVLVLMTLFIILMVDWVNLYSAIVLLILGVIYLVVLVYTDEIKIQIEEWFSLNNEEHEYSSDEHFMYKRRRLSSSDLKSRGHFDPEDPNLVKKLTRMEGLLTMKFGTNAQDHPQKKLYQTFQKSVYRIIFAVRNQVRHEKLERVEKYNEIYNPPKTKRRMNSHRSGSLRQESIVEQKPNNDDQNPLIEKKSEGSIAEQPKQAKEHNKFSRRDNVNDAKFLAPASLELPSPLFEKGMHILYFPIVLLLTLMPKVDINIFQRPIKLLVCLVLGLALTTAALFLIDWWLVEISVGSTIPLEILGSIFAGIMLSLHFIDHVLRLLDQQAEIQLVQLFFQVAVMKLTLSISIPWLVDSIVLPSVVFTYRFTTGFCYTVVMQMSMIVLFMGICVLSRFRLGVNSGTVLIVLYGAYVIIAIVLISVMK